MTDKEPNILFIDIETSPIVAYTWGPKWETNIIETLEESQVICYSAKWLNGKQQTKGLIDYTGYKKNAIDDTKIIKDIHALLDKADIVITQNGISFDHKVVNSRLLKHNMSPPSPFKMVDTKVEAKRYLRLSSYGLDDMGRYFDLGTKLSHEGFNLWKSCIAGDKKSWNLMKKYNAQDVLLTEKLYLKLRPFMKTHPNLNSYGDNKDCPKCGSKHAHAQGYVVTSIAKYHRAQCQDCGSWYRFGKPLMVKKDINRNI